MKLRLRASSFICIDGVNNVALYFRLKPTDRIAVKPHASPVFHAIQYMMGNQTLEKLKNFSEFNGAQSYPSYQGY